MEIRDSGARILVDTLVELGVETVFGIPGIHNLPVYQALLDSAIRHVTSRNEAGAGFMADGYARSTGRPGVALVITGPGLTNIMTALGEAYRDAVPILVISSQIPRTHLGRNSGYLHELENSTLVASAVTKESRRVMSAGVIPEVLRQAYALAQAGRPGPVHVEIPLDVLAEGAAGAGGGAGAGGASDTPGFAAAETALREGGRPLLIAGGGASEAPAALLALARLLGAPVVTTAAGKGVVDERDPLSLGGRLHAPAVRKMIAEADPVVVVGSELSPTDIWFDDLPTTGRLVNINSEPMDFYRTLTPSVALAGPAQELLPALSLGLRTAARSRGWGGEAEERVAQAIRRAGEELPVVVGQSVERFSRMRELLLAIRRALPEDGLLAIDMTTIAYVALSEYPAYRPRAFMHPVGFGTLGYALPAGLGARIAEAKRPVVVVTGDGGFQFTMQELGVAAQEKVTLPIIIWDDDGYGEIRRTEEERHSGRRIAVDNRNPDFLALAGAYGIPGHRAQSPEELHDRLVEALGAEGPQIIQVRAEAD